MSPPSRIINSTKCSRRDVLRGAICCAAYASWNHGAQAHDFYGRVTPAQAVPPLRVAPVDSPATDLDRLLRGTVTAMQLMFTGCSATCPIQGAMFAEVQRRLTGAAGHLRLLSVSIDPLGDDPKSLRTWLRGFGADPSRWTAALTTTQELDRLLDFLRGRATGADRHTPQVYLFDRRARLFLRTVDLPSGSSVARMMQDLTESA
jgi:protein SCO1